MAHTFDELVQKQRAADAAHATVADLREAYGPPAERGMTGAQSDQYETALRAWRDLARDVQTAVSDYARDTGQPRAEIEAEVERAAAQAQEGQEGREGWEGREG
ncbi:hypothetical protein OIB37_33335 [Streptomyces sp. NBC_00820]|uniref:hypothetical protein n=1 Tax=Streptomyces sp. NBC_00820 TaxID=2975842 RepID=UPI002ED0BA4F|nr:hypothetical protein OIB37_33335 [Streptomyces sp. NBC_00820]